ncbi:FAD-dependent oxidoreductase [Ramlibacter sp. G-1-2-2]|uniref:FAD-dependent oxidoreductase n=1 Tax=Ramlibacter agri TaxID=2728837 RepID=A0A848HAC7_9BURK|nr:FAD-dependent oxidoreductase [Ramlibacter agri]NML47745.1 FAD-dependent oxidoreductase [Ramlibacter agri]
MPTLEPGPQPATLEARHAQMFPILAADEIAHLHRFGKPRRFADGEQVYRTGKVSAGAYLVLSGAIRIVGRDSHGQDFPVVEHRSGSFSAELGQLSARPSLIDGRAVGETQTLEFSSERLHAVLIAEAALGEKLMRALILRRVALIESGAGGPVLIGSAELHDVARLRNFLARNGVPYHLLDPASDSDAQAFISRYAPEPQQLPLVVCTDGNVLRNPSETELARCIGMLDTGAIDAVYDVAIAGAGPAGLATAVYASSEGLSVVVVDSRAFGGQAGASARIENYLGFPTGISGQALAGRAYTQALKFGARMLIPERVTGFDCEPSERGEPMLLQLGDGRTARARTVVIASGARYRRPECGNLQQMEGRGVWYWASPVEAKMCAGEEVVVVGGGNSAGQAAVFLAGHASKVWMLVRGPALAASMSSYLIERITATPNIELRTRSEISGLAGSRESGVTEVTWRCHEPRSADTRRVRHVFLFLGADPSTDWLQDCKVALDDKGFVRTGQDRALPLQTSVPGVFAIGDVRAGSVKRVGAGIGEGAAVVAQIHGYLAGRAAR